MKYFRLRRFDGTGLENHSMGTARHGERNALAIIIHCITVWSCLNEEQEDTGLMTIGYELIIWASHCSPHACPHGKTHHNTCQPDPTPK